jgi:hypothetical protein
MKQLAALLLSGILLGATDPRVTIKLRPQVVMKGGAFWLTCRVPRNPHNRLLEYGVVDYRPGSQRQLDGDRAQITWQVLVEHLPCDVGPAYCAVQTDDGRWERVQHPIVIAACEDGAP